MNDGEAKEGSSGGVDASEQGRNGSGGGTMVQGSEACQMYTRVKLLKSRAICS